MYSPWHDSAEWLEADGLGGFASGTVSGIRTRRYHALLLTAVTPPTGRFVLVNGFDAWVETPSETTMITAQRYQQDVIAPDSSTRHVEFFESEPWPRWIFRLPDGSRLIEELFIRPGSSNVVLLWSHEGARGPARLFVRPFLSGRDYHSLHHANDAFRFEPEVKGERLIWRPYPGVPGVIAYTSGRYRHEPHWYMHFQYDQERARGLDCDEDLAAPGVIEFDLSQGRAALIFAAEGYGERALLPGGSARECALHLRSLEKDRRARFPSRLHRAADSYIVRGKRGTTIVAGYPWFTDWGRDTFIAMRGLCIASGRLDDAREILMSWAGTVSEGMLPNRFPDHGEAPEYNAVDASLWYIVAVHDWLAAMRKAGRAVSAADSSRLESAVLAILSGYARGTRYGIHMDADGLLAAGEPGWQLTWMDAKIDDWVVTPRIGKPVEVQALWLNALRIGAEIDGRWRDALQRGLQSFEQRFWNEDAGCLYDVVDVDHEPGRTDPTIRPNQIFAVGGLPMALLNGERAARVVETVESKLWTPLGLRTLAPDGAQFVAHYTGGPRQRDSAYHQGPAWPWLIGPFVEAWLRVHEETAAASPGPGKSMVGRADFREQARTRFLTPLLTNLDDSGLNHLSELVDGDAPFVARGCPFQAWSVGEALRLECDVLAMPAGAPTAAATAPSEPAATQPVAAL